MSSLAQGLSFSDRADGIVTRRKTFQVKIGSNFLNKRTISTKVKWESSSVNKERGGLPGTNEVCVVCWQGDAAVQNAIVESELTVSSIQQPQNHVS